MKQFLQDQRPELLAWLSLLVPGHVNQVAVAAAKLEVRAQPRVTDNLFYVTAQVGTDLVQLPAIPSRS